MTIAIRNLVSKTLNFLAPSFCVHCRTFLSERQGLCALCRQQIQPIVSVYVPLSHARTMTVHAIGAYENPLKAFVAGKFAGSRVTSRIAGQLIWELSTISEIDFDYIVPVPLHWRRYAQRGYNQAAEIAYQLSVQSGRPILELLTRHRSTPFQSQLSHEKRKENLTDAIVLNNNIPELTNKHILLVDDLMTTGATLKACGRTLLALQPAHITGAVVCRAV